MFPCWSKDADRLESSKETRGEIISFYHCGTDADSDLDMAGGGLLPAFTISLEKDASKKVLYKTSSNIQALFVKVLPVPSSL